MVQDTKRDRVWRAIFELDVEPPEYRLPGRDLTVRGFSKADIQLTTSEEVSKRTIHDTVMTALEYGLLEMVKDPAHASVAEHPITGDRSQLDLYRMAEQ